MVTFKLLRVSEYKYFFCRLYDTIMSYQEKSKVCHFISHLSLACIQKNEVVVGD